MPSKICFVERLVETFWMNQLSMRCVCMCLVVYHLELAAIML